MVGVDGAHLHPVVSASRTLGHASPLHAIAYVNRNVGFDAAGAPTMPGLVGRQLVNSEPNCQSSFGTSLRSGAACVLSEIV